MNLFLYKAGTLILTTMLISACSSTGLITQPTNVQNKEAQISIDETVVMAINVGGDAYLGADGIAYQADISNSSNPLIDIIKGSQDPTVFQSYVLGENRVDIKIENGLYDVLFRFAEPQSIKAGERVFNVVVENQVVIPALDLLLARDNQPKSAISRMVPNVKVSDGELNLHLESIVGEGVLNAIVIRNKKNVTSDWQQVWQDEFDYLGKPDADKWNYNIWPAKKVNNEDQTYTDRLKNVRVEDGVLIIEAHKEDYAGAHYTSGRIHSAGKGDLLYGRVEVSAKLPKGQGSWPAIWMMPSKPLTYTGDCPSDKQERRGNPNCDRWPGAGEIDIMEHVGYDQNRVHGTLHNRAYYWVNGEQRKASIEASNVDTQFHLYAMEWSPERIDVFYDGSLYFTYLNQGEGWNSWPYDHPFHIILNIAVGGGWGGAGGPTDDSTLPFRMEVDYVRFFKKGKAAD